MSVHVFCDESKAGGFRLAAVAVKPCDLACLRSMLRDQRLPRQRRVHFAHESDPRRRKILKALSATGIRAVVYDAPGARTEKMARDAIIGRLTEDALAMGAELLVLERDDPTVASDKQIIIERLDKAGSRGQLRYEHLRAYEEPMLWAADALIWAWSKGGSWRKRVRPMISEVIVVD